MEVLTMHSKKLAAAVAAVALSVGLAGPALTSASAAPAAPAAQAVKWDRAAVKAAAKELNQALHAAQRAFVKSVHVAVNQLKTDTADERAARKAVVTDPAATEEQKQAAREQFRADTADERAAFRAAIREALKTRHEARAAAWAAFRAAVGD
ncbi:MAG: hypothetical protein U0R64_08305 [Candidatus Nanopelagicales bacterium]